MTGNHPGDYGLSRNILQGKQHRTVPVFCYNCKFVELKFTFFSLLYNRLAYTWVIVDQELSLFYDDRPMLPVAELKIGLPSYDNLWLANDSFAWHQVWSEIYGLDGQVSSPVGVPRTSLYELFHMLLEDRLGQWDDKLEIFHMRLLLYPIYSLASQVCQIRPLLPAARSMCHTLQRPLYETSTALRVEETKVYLQRWLETYTEIRPKGLRQEALSQATLIIFNLISLNLCVSIPDVERVAQNISCRRDTNAVQEMQALGSRCIESGKEALLHCGQILSIVRGIAPELRPLWCPLAIYRVAITLWALSFLPGPHTFGDQSSTSRMRPNSDQNHLFKIAIDNLPLDHFTWRQFLRRKIENPCVTSKNGDLVPINDTERALSVCTELIEIPRAMSSLAEGVIYKLKKLASGVTQPPESTRG